MEPMEDHIDPIIHILSAAGAALCGRPGPPRDWHREETRVDPRGFLQLGPEDRARGCRGCVQALLQSQAAQIKSLREELNTERALRQAAGNVAINAVKKRDMAGAVLRELQQSMLASIARFKGQL